MKYLWQKKITPGGGDPMKEILLIVSLAAVLVYGDSVMKKIDTFLEKNQMAISREDTDDSTDTDEIL